MAGLSPQGRFANPSTKAFARADAVVLMGDGALPLPAFRGPVYTRARCIRLRRTALTDASVFAMAGIGRPEKFFQTLQAMGARVVGTRAFPDHHRYTLAGDRGASNRSPPTRERSW